MKKINYGDNNMNNEIMQTLNELNNAFFEFKNANDKRIAALEEGKSDPMLDQKIKNIDTEISNLEAKIKKLELKRPDFAIENCNEMDEKDREFKSYLLSGIKNHTPEIIESKSSVLLENSNAYRAPAYIVDGINTSLDSQSVIRKFARKIKTTTAGAEIILNTKNPDAGWLDNDSFKSLNETNFEFAKVKIPVHEIFARPKTTKSIIEDSASNIEDWIIKATVEQISNLENRAFLYGNGENQPKGIMDYNTSLHGTFDFDSKTFQEFKTGVAGGFNPQNAINDLLNVILSLKPKYLSGARWIMPRSVLSQIRQLRDHDGRYLWQPTGNISEASSLLGYPIEICDDLPTPNQKEFTKSMLFGNIYETYTIVDRDEVSIIRDPFSSKPFVEFYVTKRVGGDVTNFESLKVITFGGESRKQ